MIGLEYILQVYKLSNTELAEKLGIKRQNITCWLNGKQAVSKKHLPMLSKIFGLPEEYFQNELTEIEKIDIQIKQVDKYIDISSYIHEDDIWDNMTDEWVTIEQHYYDLGAVEKLEFLKMEKRQLELIMKIRQSIYAQKNASHERQFSDFLESQNRKIKFYERFVDIIDSSNINFGFLHEIIRAIELTDDQLKDKHQVCGERIVNCELAKDEQSMIQELLTVFRKHIEIKNKTRQESEKIRNFLEENNDEDLY